MDDRELSQLLREWKAPDAPPHLGPRRTLRSRLGWLITGTIRVPTLAVFGVLLLATLWFSWNSAERMSAPDASGPRRSGELARHPLTGALEGFDVVLVELTLPPGTSTPPHRHPGFVLGYVADGQMRFATNHELEDVVQAGGTFFEPDGAIHTTFGSASPGEPVRILAFMVVPTGRPLTGPV